MGASPLLRASKAVSPYGISDMGHPKHEIEVRFLKFDGIALTFESLQSKILRSDISSGRFSMRVAPQSREASAFMPSGRDVMGVNLQSRCLINGIASGRLFSFLQWEQSRKI